MSLGRRGNRTKKRVAPSTVSNDQRRIRILEENMLNSRLDNKTVVNPLIQRREGIKSTVTYYQATTNGNDNNLTNTSDLSGHNDLQYVKIEDFVVYFDSELDAEFSIEKFANLKTSSTLKLLPDTLHPKPQDMIHLRTRQIDVTLKINTIQPLTQSRTPEWSVEVESYAIGLHPEVASRVYDGKTYKFDLVNVGTGKTVIFEKEVYSKISDIYNLIDDIQNEYTDIFWDKNEEAFVHSLQLDTENESHKNIISDFDNGFNMIDYVAKVNDPYLNTFMLKSCIYYGKYPTIRLPAKMIHDVKMHYNRTLYNALIEGKSKYVKYYIPYLDCPYQMLSAFETVDNLQYMETLTVDLKGHQDGNATMLDNYPLATMEKIKKSELDSTSQYFIIQETLHGRPVNLCGDELKPLYNLIKELSVYSMGNLMEAYYMIPLVCYSLLYILDETVSKDSLDQTIYDNRIII